MKIDLFRRLLPMAALLLSPLSAAADTSAPAAPAIPKSATDHWSSAKVLNRAGSLTVLNLIGENHIDFLDFARVSLEGGILLDGSQTSGTRLEQRQPVSKSFSLGVDINPASDGVEHQTVVYLYAFCELRYRLSRGELAFNIWQMSADEPGKQIVSKVSLPLPPGKWGRVRATISDNVARLTINDVTSEVALPGTWQGLPESVPVFIGFGGADRAFKGRFDHLYFDPTP